MADNLLVLHTNQDDLQLTANADTERGDAISMTFGPYYLTDELGNYLTDELGNRLIAYNTEDAIYPQVLHSLPDDLILNAE